MNGTLAYRLTHSTGTVEIALCGDRFLVKTRGTGVADKLHALDIAVSELRYFGVTPTTVAQNSAGSRANRVVDSARDAELLFSYAAGGRVEKRRVFVAANDPSFVAIVSALRALRPDAALLHLSPREVYARIGVLSPQQGILIVLAALIGVPVIGVLLWVLARALL